MIEVPALSPVHAQILLAMLAQMTLTAVLLILLPVPRILAIRSKTVKRDEHGRPVFPKWATQVSDCFNNQFQMPVLFYALCLLILFLRFESANIAWLAWGFVGLRVIHALVFVTTNFVPLRFTFFILSSLAFLSMLAQVVKRLLGW